MAVASVVALRGADASEPTDDADDAGVARGAACFACCIRANAIAPTASAVTTSATIAIGLPLLACACAAAARAGSSFTIVGDAGAPEPGGPGGAVVTGGRTVIGADSVTVGTIGIIALAGALGARLGDEHRHVVVAAARVGEVDELARGLQRRIARHDLQHLARLDEVAHPVGAQDERVARDVPDGLAPHLDVDVVVDAERARDLVRLGVHRGLRGRQDLPPAPSPRPSSDRA